MKNTERVLVKLGSNVINGGEGLNEEVMSNLVREMVQLKRGGIRVLLVSSGAVAAGRALNKDEALNALPKTQREQILFGIGQVKLMSTYRRLMQVYKVHPFQILTEAMHFENPPSIENMRAPVEYAMNSDDMIPIANENDLTATDELRFTDNDHLAALLAKEFGIDAAFMLSTIDGIYDRDPADPSAQVIREIDHRSFDVSQMQVGSSSTMGRGGPVSKVENAMKMAKNGTRVYIANGTREGIIHRILRGEGEFTGVR